MTNVAIGILVSCLQPVWAQGSAAELFRVADGDRHYTAWIEQEARTGPQGWREIWRRSGAMGECLAPFLRSAFFRESNPQQRLVLIGANLLASRNPRRILLHDKLGERPRERERVLALFALALGPRQVGSPEALRRWIKRAESPLEQIAAYMALSRFEDRTLPPVERTRDPGVLAAASYCWPAQRREWIERQLRRIDDESLSGLVWRGYLLGTNCSKPADADRRSVALEILRDGNRDKGGAAAWYLAGDPAAVVQDRDLGDIPIDARLLLSRSKELRTRLLAAADGGLEGTALDFQLRRWAALIVLHATREQVETALEKWRGDPLFRDKKLRGAVCLALASRLLRLDPEKAQAFKAMVELDRTEYGPWLRIARGLDPTGQVPAFEDAELARAFPLARKGQLPRPALADLMDAALWRLGDHPARAGLDLHRQFFGELLLDGTPGTNFAQRMRRTPYVAKGLSREEPLFKIGFELFKFLDEAEPWLRQEYRLLD